MIFKAKYSMNKKIRIANANAVPLIYYSKFNSNFDHDLNKLLESFSPISKKISATQLCPSPPAIGARTKTPVPYDI